jgi:orotidine-5'-phosphate decarboxylase
MKFRQKLQTAWQTSNSLLMVGLDPDPNKLPVSLKQKPDALFAFCQGIVDATAPYVCGFKPQIAYFAAARAEPTLEAICQYIRDRYPHLILLLDAKRGDIGSTAQNYAAEAFDRYQADAVTISPYMGHDSAMPYLERKDKGVIVLCRTSNPGGSDLQSLSVDGLPLYLRVAEMVAHRWNTDGQCGLVVGATFPQELAAVRAHVGDELPLLVPGIGAQGGDIESTCDAGCSSNRTGMMINSSRAILYASHTQDWAEQSAQAALLTRDAINAARNKRPS